MTKRADEEILAELRCIEARLLPENISCDGELSQRQVARKRVQLNDAKGWLIAELGRSLTTKELESMPA